MADLDSMPRSSGHRADVLVSCLHGRVPEFLPALKEEIARRGLADEMRVVETGCRGFCSMGPVLTIEPPGTFYTNVTAADVPEVVEETLVKGRIVHSHICDLEEGGAG